MWLAFRIAFIAAWAIAAVSQSAGSAALQAPFWVALAALAAAALTMRLWVKPLYPHIVYNASWARPKWGSNPFSLREPLQAFHLIAMSFLAFSIASFARLAIGHPQVQSLLDAPALVVGGWAVGMLLGIAWVHEPSSRVAVGKPNDVLERTREG